MTRVIDVWRAVDPEARLVSGAVDALHRPVRGVTRTRAVPPHLPPMEDGQLLVVGAELLVQDRLETLVAGLADASLAPSALWIVGGTAPDPEPAVGNLPVIASAGRIDVVVDRVADHLRHEPDRLAELAVTLRLAGAEAALADPRPAAPAGVLASRMRRGVAVSEGTAIRTVNPRPAGRALATRFVAVHARLLSTAAGGTGEARYTRDGLWVLRRSITPGADAWLFDDLPLARADEVALDALAMTLRALVRRGQPEPTGRRLDRLPPSTGDPLRDTLLAVARANGRIAPAARALGVHRNTVLYRLKRASADLGVDPRRPADAIRLLRESAPRE